MGLTLSVDEPVVNSGVRKKMDPVSQSGSWIATISKTKGRYRMVPGLAVKAVLDDRLNTFY
jgi:hypothetical protein